MKLLSRDVFRERVFARDGRCVWCFEHHKDAHHLIERKLFNDGGYYLDNGVALCEECHWAAEKTNMNPVDLRAVAGISNIILPEGFDSTLDYDKWGNVILGDGRRIAGPLFSQENVQKVIREHIYKFV